MQSWAVVCWVLVVLVGADECPDGGRCQEGGTCCSSPVKDVPCDGTTGCPDGTTCCKTQQGGWACCPLTEAVCCEDHLHCCPKGQKCNLAAQTCDDGLLSVPLAKKIPSIPRKDVQLQVKDVPCDPTHACPDGNTCCKNTADIWACCPLNELILLAI
uniref:Granulins domain-containing protein n=1 Tax=Kryptolebias marmoratus TaxID=37003 RepID=A0A3Q3BFN7_KRYMA